MEKVKTILQVPYEFGMIHSLSVREVPHVHKVRVVAEISAKPKSDGFIVNILEVKDFLKSICIAYENTNLNRSAEISEKVRAFPTTENLTEELFKRCISERPDWGWTALQLSLFDLDGGHWGTVRVQI